MTSFNPKTGDITYIPNSGFIGNDIFDFHVTDNHNKTSNMGIISISVSNQSSTPSHSVTSLLDKAIALIRLGNYKQTITDLNQVLGIDPMNNPALLDKGIALVKLGNYTQAISYLKSILEMDHRNIQALDYMGSTLASLHNYTQAIQYYNEALAINPSDGFALAGKGQVLDTINRIQNTSRMSTYENGTYGIKMQYPS